MRASSGGDGARASAGGSEGGRGLSGRGSVPVDGALPAMATGSSGVSGLVIIMTLLLRSTFAAAAAIGAATTSGGSGMVPRSRR